MVADRRFQLLEALADAVAAALLDRDGGSTAVAVTVRKLRPPVPFDVGVGRGAGGPPPAR